MATKVAPQSNWQQFVATATKVAKKQGFPVGVLLGQAALESARGTAAPGNNYFGIKGVGTAGTQNLATKEFGQGNYYSTNSGFRAYNSPEESINDYINLIKTQYPQAWALKDNPQAMLQAIHQGGYATDPNYVQSVMSTPEFQAEHGNLQQLASAQPTQPMQFQDQEQQQAPIDPSAQMPQVQNIAGQTTSYPLRSEMGSMDIGGQGGQADQSGGQQMATMPQGYRQSVPVSYGQVPAFGYDYGGQTSQYNSALPSAQAAQQDQTGAAPTNPTLQAQQGQQTADQSQQQSGQTGRTYQFGPITITS